MTDLSTQWLTDMSEEVHFLAVEKGWYQDDAPNFAEKIALVHSELSETLEWYRQGRDPRCIHYTSTVYKDSPGVVEDKPDGIAVELADAIIRILDMCAEWDIPIAEAVQVKHEYNKTRPHRHGGKVC